MDVSINHVTYNYSSLHWRLLGYRGRATGPPAETIVVGQSSTDDTRAK